MGKSLIFEWEGEPMDFKVTGILKEVPETSHVQFDMLMSMATYPETRFPSWRSNYLYTYVLVGENTSKSDLEIKLKTFVERRLEPVYGDLLSQGLGIHEVLKMHLFPITDIHLHPSENWEMEAGGNMASVTIFSSIAVLILIIACINFMNLSTARGSKRAKEVSLRKTVGATKAQLRRQFIQESVLLALTALILAYAFSALLVPVYHRIFTEALPLSSLFQLKNLVLFLVTAMVVGVVAGLYPALYLTHFEAGSISKGGPLSGNRKSVFRRNMVILQFGISITLIIGMFTVYKQMKYIQTRNLGFDKENVVLIPVRSRQVGQRFETIRNTLLSNSQILSVSSSADLPGENILSNTTFLVRQDVDEPMSFYYITTDYDFIETYRMGMLSGREFSKAFATDTAGTLILNEAAVRRIGWTNEEAIGKELIFMRSAVGKVVGVVKDFHYRSLHMAIEPMALVLNPDYIRDISVRVKPGDMGKNVDFIQRKWEETFPGERFEYSFLDDRIDQLYARERKMQNIFVVFSSLSVFVACLGLLGLAVFTAEVRTKEIGIRKVLGASTGSVTFLLSKAFVKWILIANIAAWPLAWFMMNKWLQNFAYKANMGWFVFLFSGALTLLVAIFTFILQALKAAYANPVEALKYE